MKNAIKQCKYDRDSLLPLFCFKTRAPAQYSVGSGKSNSIARTTHRPASLHDDQDGKVFQSGIVITDADTQAEISDSGTARPPQSCCNVQQDFADSGIILLSVQKVCFIRLPPQRRVGVL